MFEAAILASFPDSCVSAGQPFLSSVVLVEWTRRKVTGHLASYLVQGICQPGNPWGKLKSRMYYKTKATGPGPSRRPQSFSPSWEAGPRPDETKGRFRVWISAVYGVFLCGLSSNRLWRERPPPTRYVLRDVCQRESGRGGGGTGKDQMGYADSQVRPGGELCRLGLASFVDGQTTDWLHLL